jgi:DNA polymerase III epsilon subunit-like protein
MKVCIFDTETTDLIRNHALPLEKQPQIVEIYANLIEQTGEGKDATFHEYKPFHRLFDIGKPIPEITTKITGITDAIVKEAGGRPFSESATLVRHAVLDVDRLVAHNLSYDKGMLTFEFARSKVKIDKWPQLVCTVESTEHFKGFRLNLSKLHEHLFGEKFEGAHRAKADVDALTRCYKRLVTDGVI